MQEIMVTVTTLKLKTHINHQPVNLNEDCTFLKLFALWLYFINTYQYDSINHNNVHFFPAERHSKRQRIEEIRKIPVIKENQF